MLLGSGRIPKGEGKAKSLGGVIKNIFLVLFPVFFRAGSLFWSISLPRSQSLRSPSGEHSLAVTRKCTTHSQSRIVTEEIEDRSASTLSVLLGQNHQSYESPSFPLVETMSKRDAMHNIVR